MAPNKRAGGRNDKAPKKLKLDPVTVKVNEVLDALSKDECEVPGPPSCREGLLAAVPHALGLGAAIDERHVFQTSVARMVGDILNASEVKLQQILKEAKENHEASKTEQVSRDAALEDTQHRLATQHTEVKERKDRLLADIVAEKETKKALEAATSEVTNFDTLQLAKVSHRDELGAVLRENFEALRSGEFANPRDEHVHLNKLTAMLKKLNIDKSLENAIPAALAKKPIDRGGFDETVVSQVHDALKENLETLENELGNGEALKKQKESELSAAQASRANAEKERMSSQEAVTAAEETCSELQAEVKRAQHSTEEQKEAVSDLEIRVFIENVKLESLQSAIQAFAFLRDRVADTPAPEGQGELMTEGCEPVMTAA